MSLTTSNYGFVKPELTDVADITAINPNWDKIDNELKSQNDNQVSKVVVGNVITIDNSANLPFVDMHIYGKSTQDGIPTPEAPIDIKSVAEDGNVKVSITETEQSITVSTPNGLAGIPVSSGGNYTDENGQKWICDEIDFGRGVYVQRIEKFMFDGSEDEDWRNDSTNNVNQKRMVTSNFKSKIKITPNGQFGNILCDKFRKARANDTYNLVEGISIDDIGRVHIYCSSYNSEVTNWTAFLASNPMTVIYELATPIETPLSSTELATYAQLVTNNPNTTILNDSGADMSVEYYTAKKERTVEHMASGFGKFGKVLWENENGIGEGRIIEFDASDYSVFAVTVSEGLSKEVVICCRKDNCIYYCGSTGFNDYTLKVKINIGINYPANENQVELVSVYDPSGIPEELLIKKIVGIL